MGNPNPVLEKMIKSANDIADANGRTAFAAQSGAGDGQLQVAVVALLSAHGDAGERMKAIASVVLALLVAGCAAAPPIDRSDLLGFLVDGNTAKTEVLSKLGRPSGTFAAEGIFTYRIEFESKSKGYWVVGRETDASPWPIWERANYSLVLVFNNQGVLEKHSLVNIKGINP